MNRREFLQLAGVSALSGVSILSSGCSSVVGTASTSASEQALEALPVFPFASPRSNSNLHPARRSRRLATTARCRGLCSA